MRDVNRIPKVLTALQEVWVECPDMRFGQLIENIMTYFDPAIVSNDKNWRESIENCLWNWEEDHWIAAIDCFNKKLEAK